MKTKEGVLKSPLTKICSLPHKEGQYEPESPRPFITKFQTKNLTSREVFYIKVTFLALLSWITLAIQLNIPSQMYIKLNSLVEYVWQKGSYKLTPSSCPRKFRQTRLKLVSYIRTHLTFVKKVIDFTTIYHEKTSCLNCQVVNQTLGAVAP